MKYGESGDRVRQLQLGLDALGFEVGPIDGVFGALTEDALRLFQSYRYAHGRVDDLTIAGLHDSLCEEIKPPTSIDELHDTFGHFQWKDSGKGYVSILGDWVSRNIGSILLPGGSRRWMHRRVMWPTMKVFRELETRGILGEIKTFYTFCPRHKMHDIHRSLSLHSWGIAFDVNASTNRPGMKGDLTPELIQAFKTHGFEWGGDWKNPDPMHFQYAHGL